jgi:hypothetical protein
MKKNILYALLFLPTLAFGQLSQGKVQFSMDFSIHSLNSSATSNGTSLGDATQTDFNITPTVSYFFTDKLSIGLTLLYSSTKNSSDGSKSSMFGIGPALGYYSMIGDRFGIFAKASFAYISETATQPISGVDYQFDGSGFGITLQPGFIYFLHNNFAFEASMTGFQYMSVSAQPSGGISYKETNTQTILDLKMSTINLGLVLLF